MCDEALNVNPDDAKVHFLRAVSLYGARQVDASIQEFRIAIAKNPRTENTRADLADSHADLAIVLKDRKQFDEAQKECLAALDLKPESVEALRTLGEILLAQGDPMAAAEKFRTALKFKPDDALSSQGLLASELELIRKFLSDARPEVHTQALEIARRLCERTEDKNIFALELLAGAYATTGDFKRAEASIRKALETPLGQQPNNAAVLRQRIEFYQAHKNVPIPRSKL